MLLHAKQQGFLNSDSGDVFGMDIETGNTVETAPAETGNTVDALTTCIINQDVNTEPLVKIMAPSSSRAKNPPAIKRLVSKPSKPLTNHPQTTPKKSSGPETVREPTVEQNSVDMLHIIASYDNLVLPKPSSVNLSGLIQSAQPITPARRPCNASKSAIFKSLGDDGINLLRN